MVSRRSFLRKAGTVAFGAAILPAISALPALAERVVPPAEVEPWDFLQELQDPAIGDTVRFTSDVAAYQMRQEDVDQWIAELRTWGFPRPADMTDRQLAAAAAVSLWFSRMSRAEFYAHHARTYERFARPYWELKDALKAQREQAA